MIILPAIDIKEGQCVRLLKGDFATVHKVAENPMDTARSFKEKGAVWLHMVDLDGAVQGRRINSEIFTSVGKESGLRVELGGGIRDTKTVELYLENGIERVIIGSAAFDNPQLVTDSVKEFGERVAVGIDARDRKVATRGWLDTTDMDFIELAKRMEDKGVKYIIFTDISKDGTLQGPSVEQLCELKEAVSCSIIASGGIAVADDISSLKSRGIYAAICGKSIYSGSLKLEEAIERAGEQNAG